MPLITLILSNKRWIIIAILCFVVFCQLWQSQSLVNDLRKAKNKCEDEKQAIYDSNRKVQEKAQADLAKMSELYEIEKSKERVINNERIKEVQTIIRNNPVYTDCKLTDSVYDTLREATAAK